MGSLINESLLGQALRAYWADYVAPIVTTVSAMLARMTSAEGKITTLEQSISGFSTDDAGYIIYNYPEEDHGE